MMSGWLHQGFGHLVFRYLFRPIANTWYFTYIYRVHAINVYATNIATSNITSHMILTASPLFSFWPDWDIYLLPCVQHVTLTLSVWRFSSNRLTKKLWNQELFSVEKCRRPRVREFSYRLIQACWVIEWLFCCFHRKHPHIHAEPVSIVDHGHMGVEYKGTKIDVFSVSFSLW